MNKQEIVERILKLAPESRVKRDEYCEYLHGWQNACQDFAERLAESAAVVTGWSNKDGTHLFGSESENDDTHTALLIDVQPIKKKDELVERLRERAESLASEQYHITSALLLEAASRIEAANDDK